MVQYLITAFIDFIVGGLALSKKGNPAAKALGLTICCLGLWSLELYFLTSLNDMDLLDPLFHLSRWGMFFAPAFFTLLTWRLLGSRSQAFKRAVIIPSFVLSIILSLGNFIFFPSELIKTDGGFLPKTDPIFYAFGIHFVWCFLSSLLFVASSYKTALSREKQRLKWVLITLTVCFFIGIVLIKTMPQDFYLSKFMGPISNIIFVAFLFYTTVQHNLMDIRLALSVGLTKAILLASIVWAYFLVNSLVESDTQSVGGAVTLLAFFVVMLEIYPRLLKWALPNAKKIFVKEGYDLEQVKTQTEVDLKNSISFPMMLDVLDHLFLKSIKINNYKLLMVEGSSSLVNPEHIRAHRSSFELIPANATLVTYCASQSQLLMADEMPGPLFDEMKEHNAALCFPVVSENNVIAIMLVGSPTNFSYYRYDDLKILEWLRGELGQVLNRLIRLNNMQEQLAEAKKTLSMLSLMNHYHHDIKVPFAIIDGVLSNDIYDRDKQRDIVLEQVARGSKLIATMAGILGGQHKRRIQACSLEELVQDCLYLFETSFDRIECAFGNIPKIKGDAEDLKILFINLIKNAAEARRDAASLVLSIQTWVANDRICLSVRDSGTGMTHQQLADLWEPRTSTKKYGNGIGMQAIKRIVDEHHGHIDVSSTPGQGSEFILQFHLTQASLDDTTDDTRDELAERRASYQVGKRSHR